MTSQAKPFNLKGAAKGSGYEIPPGAVISWNDFSRFFKVNVADSKYLKNKDEFEDNFDNPLLLKVERDYIRKVTAIGLAFKAFSEHMKMAINDGRIGLFQRLGCDYSNAALPLSLREESVDGFMLSVPEIQEVFKDFLAENLASENEFVDDDALFQTGIRQWHEFLQKAFVALPDYSDIEFEAVNNPIPLHKVKNRPSQRLRQKADLLLKQGGMS